jgi:hypothetical protein
MLSVTIKSIMLNVIMLSVVMLNVVAPILYSSLKGAPPLSALTLLRNVGLGRQGSPVVTNTLAREY